MFSLKNNAIQKYARIFFCVVTAMLMMIACTPVERSGEMYYNLDSLFNAQISYLKSSHTKLRKSAWLDQKHDTTSYIPKDSAAWTKEFEVIAELALINKPIYQGLYTVTDEPDTKSNLRVLSYQAKKDKEDKLPVSFVRIYYLSSLDKIKRIEGAYRETNDLFTESQILSIELQDVYNKTVITSYSIKGEQKMILADSVGFQIEGRLDVK